MGFGFIGPDDGGADLFAEMSELHAARPDGVRVGDRFAYEVAPEQRLGKACAARLRAPPNEG
jgi:cold shock CspA family protein